MPNIEEEVDRTLGSFLQRKGFSKAPREDPISTFNDVVRFISPECVVSLCFYRAEVSIYVGLPESLDLEFPFHHKSQWPIEHLVGFIENEDVPRTIGFDLESQSECFLQYCDRILDSTLLLSDKLYNWSDAWSRRTRPEWYEADGSD